MSRHITNTDHRFIGIDIRFYQAGFFIHYYSPIKDFSDIRVYTYGEQGIYPLLSLLKCAIYGAQTPPPH
jgi:hypothetical protein